jgi:hypothetical protein
MFIYSFFLAKKNQKPKAKDQLQSFSHSKCLRNAAEKMVYPLAGPKLITLCPALFRQKQPHYYQRMISVLKMVISLF